MRALFIISLLLVSVSAAPVLVKAQTLGDNSETQKERKASRPLSQEEQQERELERAFSTSVERDRIQRGGVSETTFDRYGDGPIGVFQNNTSSERNIDDDDSIGINIRLFEFE